MPFPEKADHLFVAEVLPEAVLLGEAGEGASAGLQEGPSLGCHLLSGHPFSVHVPRPVGGEGLGEVPGAVVVPLPRPLSGPLVLFSFLLPRNIALGKNGD